MGEKIRTFEDEMGGLYQSREEGSYDITVHRDRLGFITSLTVLQEGDAEFDKRTRELERESYGASYDNTYDVGWEGEQVQESTAWGL